MSPPDLEPPHSTSPHLPAFSPLFTFPIPPSTFAHLASRVSRPPPTIYSPARTRPPPLVLRPAYSPGAHFPEAEGPGPLFYIYVLETVYSRNRDYGQMVAPSFLRARVRVRGADITGGARDFPCRKWALYCGADTATGCRRAGVSESLVVMTSPGSRTVKIFHHPIANNETIGYHGTPPPDRLRMGN